MPAIIVVGAQWGDEGKGKVIDCLSAQATHVVRSQGGNNAGHTVIIDQIEYKLHLIPSGILYPHTLCYIGGGTVVDPEVLIEEMNYLQEKKIDFKNRLKLSGYAHVILPYHCLWDKLAERKKGSSAIGTTGRGIGPCYADKVNRIGIRLAEFIDSNLLKKRLRELVDLKNEELKEFSKDSFLQYEKILETSQQMAEILTPYVCDVEKEINDALDAKHCLLLEGAQGTFLDITFGTYPYVTSSQTIAAGICTGAGIGPTRINHTVGVVKAYTTRVGNGPFPSELKSGEIFLDHNKAREIGTTTGRNRRIGWFDAVLVRQAVRLNGIDSIALTKLDILNDVKEIKICTGYERNGKIVENFPITENDFKNLVPIYETMEGWNQPLSSMAHLDELPVNAKKYITKIENLCKAPVSLLSVGPERERTILCRKLFGENCVPKIV